MTTEARICAACEAPLAGRYCHECGQDSRAKPAPLREMAVQVATSYSPIDGKLARTLAVLATRPGRLLNAYRSGAGSLYVTPLKLFVASTALFLAVLNFSDTTLYQYVWKVDRAGAPVTTTYDPTDFSVTVHGATEQDRWLQARIDPAIDPEVIAALNLGAASATTPVEREAMRYELTTNEDEARWAHRVSAWLPNLLWLLMPLYAVALMPFFGRGRLFLEHVIFAMWAHAITFLLAMGLSALNSRGLNLSAGLLAFPYLGYFTVAASKYYDMSWVQALWRGVVHMLIYVFLILLPVAFILYLTVMDWGAFWALLEA